MGAVDTSTERAPVAIASVASEAFRPPKGGWFHSIDLGNGEVTRGKARRGAPANYTLFGFFEMLKHIDLAGTVCCDVGTMDGLAAFIMKQAGAARVIACDMAERSSFKYARQRLGLDVEYKTPVSAQALADALGTSSVDFLLLAGVLYHVYDPLSVLVQCRRCLRREGLLVVETIHSRDSGKPTMVFNPVDPSRHHLELSNVFWRPTKAALYGMLHLVGFEVLASITVNSRLTVLAGAKRPDEIAGRSPMIQQAHHWHRNRHYREASDFGVLAGEETEPSHIRYQGPSGDRFLHRGRYVPEVPFQPQGEAHSPLRRFVELAKSVTRHGAFLWDGVRSKANAWRRQAPARK